MPFNGDTRLRSELGRDEQLLWSGTPAQGVRFRMVDIFLVPFSVMWGGFALFWEATAFYQAGVRVSATPPYITGSEFSFMTLWGIPFCLIGLYMIFGRFFVDAAARAKTAYAVTDRRIIITCGNSVQSLTLNNLPQIELKTGANGRGSIIFGQSNLFMGTGWPAWGVRGTGPSLMFDGIAKVREVHTLIIDAAQKSKGR
ncbi:hypothetical protein [Asticcacaulis sp. 201]|uniref:hypothetical protein n=1 Tax=Asticcacaulis sp. 201 TaxID=3028787 RepID=UPI002916BD10|nr:hypothetical protein [Asticcacaulis sp. 201]MDV6330119.1 hypothetical protein [Asticcacaulis sp. 201]